MGKNNLPQDVDLSRPSHISDAGTDPPRLALALLKAPAGKDDRYKTSVEKAGHLAELDDPATYRENITRILAHLRERLTIGLDEAWASSFGYDGEPDTSAEEAWARRFSELVVYAAYGGVAACYGTKGTDGGLDDMNIVRRLDKGEDDPAYPIILACQHLTTLCAMSRGVGHTELGARGMTAGGGTRGLPIFSGSKAWYVTSSGERTETGSYRNLKHLIENCGLSPGSVFAFNSLGPDSGSQAGQAHIGAVLRLREPDGFQGIDTGPLAAGHDDEGTADHGLTKGQMTALSGILVGVGVLPKDEPSAAQIAFLAKARPLGFTQLVIVDASRTVRYMSRLLPMEDAGKGFSISRYIWSVRNLPAKGLQVYWILSIPRIKALTEALVAPGARGKPVRELLGTELRGKTFEELFEPVHVIGSTPMVDEADAGPIVRRRKLDGAKNEWSKVPLRPGTRFPSELGNLKFADGPPGQSFYGRWRRMTVDMEYTCADPANRDNPPISDLTTSMPYFRGPDRSPLPEETMVGGKPGLEPMPS